jgi:Arc/MetJ-type ribon-helix-helix transcriptional regulator
MPVAKVAINIDEHVLREIDRWVSAGEYSSRSQVMQAAIAVLKEQRDRRRALLEDLTKLDPLEERSLADEHLAAEATWPAF